MESSEFSTSLANFVKARQFLLDHRLDYQRAYEEFSWPALDEFNWALDWFGLLASQPESANRAALTIVDDDGHESSWTFAELDRRTNQVANWFKSIGVKRGDRILLMLGNQVELWEVVLAAMKTGAVIIPSTTLLSPSDLADRIERGEATYVITTASQSAKFQEIRGNYVKIAVGDEVKGYLPYTESLSASASYHPDTPTQASDTLLLYFTSGTTAKPKLVHHTHASYPVGHLSTMFWIGLEPGDIHLNISSPGWAKHAWSSIFAPWNAGATIMVYNYDRFDPGSLLEKMERFHVTSFCAPPTVWRMLVLADMSSLSHPPRKAVSAGEPLNPEIISQVKKVWGCEIRDGYGQTETTVQIANPPGTPLVAGSMGWPMPGYRIALIDVSTDQPAEEGEVCIDLSQRPLGLMVGYLDDPDRTAEVMRNGFYHTSDLARREPDGNITYVGRVDDVFKSSGYRISPFELESVLIEHPAVAEAAVVPAPDPIRYTVPKAYVMLAGGNEATRETAQSIFSYTKSRLAPYKRIRRIEFANELPKTISGKIRRSELRAKEFQAATTESDQNPNVEYREEDFPELRT